jgi:hypothetical protein
MGVEDYIEWVRDVNLEAFKVNKCLSCFKLKGSILKEYYQEGLTPFFTVVKLMVGTRQKDKCICKQKCLK